MASRNFLQGGLCCNDAHAWPKQAVLWIESLSEQQILLELQRVMDGWNYSWHSINELLQGRLDQGDLEFTLVDGDVLFEWNNLCDEKRGWERKGRLSDNCAEFNRDCLINLMILPFQGGLGLEGKFSTRSGWFDLTRLGLRLVTTNVDKQNLSTIDLWVAYEKREFENFTDGDSEDTDDDDDDDDNDDDDDESLSWVVEDSEYSNEDANYEYAECDEFGDSDIEDKDREDLYIEEDVEDVEDVEDDKLDSEEDSEEDESEED